MAVYDFSKFPDLLKRAGLNGSEAAPLFRVSRTTIYNWIGKPDEGRPAVPPHQSLVRLFAERQVKVIEKAIEAGDLPLKEVAATDRKRVLVAVIQKHSRISS